MLALLAGTGTAFALTEVLKLEGSPISRPKFDVVLSPLCGCRHETAKLPIGLRKAQTVTAAIVDGDENVVRTLVSDRRFPRGRTVFLWDGRDEGGAVVPDGTYRLRLSLDEAGRMIVVPNDIRVDTEAPTLGTLTLSATQIVAGEEPVTVVVRSSEQGRLILSADGVRVARGTVQDAGVQRLVWDGTVRGRPLRRGTYTLTAVARDFAGNVSAATPGVEVEIVRPGA
jgi:flagellar hook assembly protein FlgD